MGTSTTTIANGTNLAFAGSNTITGAIVCTGNITQGSGNTTFGGGGVVCGSPTGGNKGNGTLNASNVYDDNVLLTCYVLEVDIQGDVDTAKWDGYVANYDTPAVINEKGIVITPAKIADRNHDPARAFQASRMDEVDVDVYVGKWKASGVLPGMPTPEEWTAAQGFSTGNIIQRLWETAELHAVHVANLNDRLTAVERKLAA